MSKRLHLLLVLLCILPFFIPFACGDELAFSTVQDLYVDWMQMSEEMMVSTLGAPFVSRNELVIHASENIYEYGGLTSNENFQHQIYYLGLVHAEIRNSDSPLLLPWNIYIGMDYDEVTLLLNGEAVDQEAGLKAVFSGVHYSNSGLQCWLSISYHFIFSNKSLSCVVIDFDPSFLDHESQHY